LDGPVIAVDRRPELTGVIAALVAAIHPSARSGTCGWLDPGHEDTAVRLRFGGQSAWR
jgi:hypothetical protein